MKLPVSIKPHGDETPLSFASRLAAANSYPSLDAFLRFTDTNVNAIKHGEPGAIRMLSGWSGEECSKLASFAMHTAPRRLSFKLGEALFSHKHRRRKTHRFCAECVQDDLRNGRGRRVALPYVRAWWETRVIQTCPVHGSQIMEVACEADQHDFGRFVEGNQHLFGDSNEVVELRWPREMDQYMIGRIRGEKAYPFLDELEAYVVADLCIHFGRFLRRHRSVVSEENELPQEREDGELGFQSVKLGEEHLSELVSTILRDKALEFRDVRVPLAPIPLWLRRNKTAPEFATLIELFQELAEKNSPLGPGQICIVPAQKRYRHSVRSASLEYGLTQKRVIELLKNAEIIPPSCGYKSKTSFDAELAKPILQAAQETLSLTEAAAIVGLSGPRLHDIIEAELLRRVEGNRGDRRPYTRIRRDDLLDFQNRLFQNAQPMRHPSDYLPILEVTRKCRCQLHEIVEMVLSGQLKGIAQTKGDMVFSNLYIDWKEAREKRLLAVKEEIGQELLSIKEVAAELKTAQWKVYPLVESKALPSIAMRNPTTSKEQFFVERKSLEEFKSRYISCAELAAIHGTRADTIARRLEELYIKPSFHLNNPSRRYRLGRYYRQTDLRNVKLESAAV